MNVLRKVAYTRCANVECDNYKDGVKLRVGALHCEKCGERLKEVKVINKPVAAVAALVFAALVGFGSYRIYRVIASAFEAAEYAHHIAQGVLTQLKQAPELKGVQVQVGFKNGVVTLTGRVSSQSEKDAVEEIARKVSGVKQVINQLALAVNPPPLRSPPGVASSPAAAPKGSGASPTAQGTTGRGSPTRVSTQPEAISERQQSAVPSGAGHGGVTQANTRGQLGNEPSSTAASSQGSRIPSSAQAEQITSQQQQLEATVAKQQQQQSEMQTQQARLQEEQQQLEEEVRRLREEKAKAQAAPPAQPVPAYNGPSSGTIEWQGEVTGTELVDITDGHSAEGSVRGSLPGIPCMVQPTDPKHVSVAIGPMPESGWKRIVIRVHGKGRTVVRLTWTTL